MCIHTSNFRMLLLMMMMIAGIAFNSSLVPLIEGLCSLIPWEFEFSGFRWNRTDNLEINNLSFWPTEPRLQTRASIHLCQKKHVHLYIYTCTRLPLYIHQYIHKQMHPYTLIYVLPLYILPHIRPSLGRHRHPLHALQHTATHCNTLQHNTPCNTLQTAIHEMHACM